MTLKVCTFNCCSLRKNIDIVRDLTSKKVDLLFLQETFVNEDRLGDLAFIDENYEVIGSPAIYSDKAIESCVGRCEGGLAILWRKDSAIAIRNIIIERDYMVISIIHKGKIIIFVNVYI